MWPFTAATTSSPVSVFSCSHCSQWCICKVPTLRLVCTWPRITCLTGVMSSLQVPAAVIDVTVHECLTGQVPQAGQSAATTATCTLCPAVTYSFDPNNHTCLPCPVGARCDGGATFGPEPPYWHSKLGSNHTVLCPNPNACQRNMTDVMLCQNATYFNNIASIKVGHLALSPPQPPCFAPHHILIS